MIGNITNGGICKLVRIGMKLTITTSTMFRFISGCVRRIRSQTCYLHYTSYAKT